MAYSNVDAYLNKYKMHSEFAAGFAEQQMKDRESAYPELAVYCQEQAAFHANEARAYRDMYMAYYSDRYAAR